MKILLVEDDQPTAWALSKTLRAHHYTVTLAYDGETGVELAQSRTYDLILLDIVLPKMDGITLCRHLRSLDYQNPILFLTAKNTIKDRVIGLNAGADDYLVKPIDAEELTARLRALLRRVNYTSVPLLEIEQESPQQQVIASLSQLWQKFKSTFIAQVEVLEQASLALLEDHLTPELQQKAKQQAHKLAGSLGTFGFAKASKLARQIELLLQTEGTIEQEEALQISELVGQLQQELSQPPYSS